jgi:hypothetical protein
MTVWNSHDFASLGEADEVQISAVRRDGSLRNPVTIWVVPHGGELYVRSANGGSGGWYRGTQVRHEGHIRAAGVDKDVVFVDVTVDDGVQDQVDAAYRSKYRRYGASYIDMMLAPQARAATLKLILR